jgi:hypothetical protein|tara:strand:+ start:14542 stop:14946 length:405 start_codon:yes stop_codon:yes gene_type:complete
LHSGADNNDKRERVLELLEEEAFLRSQLTVTASDYRESVLALVRLAQGDTSGSRTAAQVLLSLYDGSEWHRDLTDLGVLDWGYLQHALIVIRGRLVLGQSVEAAIDNGDQVFSHLCALWAGLRNDRRYSNRCDD